MQPKNIIISTHICHNLFLGAQGAGWEGGKEFEFGVVGPVQQQPKEHRNKDGEVEENVKPPWPGKTRVKCKENNPAADNQDGILDTVEFKQFLFLGRIIVEMRVVRTIVR